MIAVLRRIVWWWLLSVGIALLPVAILIAHLWTDGPSISLGSVLGDGQLYLVAVAVMSAPMVAVIRQASRPGYGLTGLLALLAIVFAAGAYGVTSSRADVRTQVQSHRQLEQAAQQAEKRDHRIAWLSLAVFCFSLGVGTACAGLAHADD